MLGLGLSIPSIAVRRPSAAASLPLTPSPAPTPFTASNVSGPSYQNTGSTSHYVQSTGASGGLKLAVNVVDANNMLFLQADNGDNGFFLYLRNGGVDGAINFYSMDLGAVITNATLRRIQIEVLSPTSNKITLTVGTTVKIFTAGALPFANVTQAGIYSGTAPSIEIGALASPLLIVSAAYNAAANAIDAVITYSGSPDYYEYTLDGVGSYAAATTVAVPSAGNATIRIPVTAPMRGTTQTLSLRQHNLTSAIQAIDVPVPAPMIMGINDSSGTTFSWTELGPSLDWYDPDSSYKRVLHRNEVAAVGFGHWDASATGSVGFKRDMDGKIYATNAVGTTRLALEVRIFLPTTEAGTYAFSLPAGVNCSRGDGVITYNQGSGQGTIDLVAGQNATFLMTDLSTWGTNGVLPTFHKQGTSPTQLTLSSTYVSNTQPMGSILRLLNNSGVNNSQMPGRTTTAIVGRALADRTTNWPNQEDVEHQIAKVNALGWSLWYQPSHLDADDLIAFCANKIATTTPLAQTHYTEWSNELFNDRFIQTDDTILTGVRLGYAPDAATTVSHPAETILDGVDRTISPKWIVPVNTTTAQTTRAFSTGDKFLIEYSGYKVFKALANIPSGTNFAIAGDSNVQALYDNGKTRQAQARYTATRTKQIYSLFASEFTAAGRSPVKIVVGGAFSQGYSWVSPVLHWDNCGAITDYVALGVYYGGGTAGLDMGPYTSTSVTGWAPAQKDALWGGTSAVGIAAAKDAFFAASPAVITATLAVLRTYATDLDADASANGWPTKLAAYEANWHVIFSGWPDMAQAYNSGSGYSTGDFVKWTDNAVYVASQAVPAGTTPANGSYWTLKLSAAVVAEQRSEALFSALIKDSRQGRDLTQLWNGWKNICGGPIINYERVSVISSQQGSWGFSDNEQDTAVSGGSINYRYKALLDFKASL